MVLFSLDSEREGGPMTIPARAGHPTTIRDLALLRKRPARKSKRAPTFIGALGRLGISLKTTNTICQNPFAAFSAGAENGKRVTLFRPSGRASNDCSMEARESFGCFGQHCLHTIAG